MKIRAAQLAAIQQKLALQTLALELRSALHRGESATGLRG
jgi:hypothetical protein